MAGIFAEFAGEEHRPDAASAGASDKAKSNNPKGAGSRENAEIKN